MDIERLKELAEAKGARFVEGPDFVKGKWKNIEVSVRRRNEKIITEIKGVAIPVKGILELTAPVRQTIYVGLAPIRVVTYKEISPKGVRDKIKCFIRTMVEYVLGMLILGLPILGPLDLLFLIVLLLIAPIIAAWRCGII